MRNRYLEKCDKLVKVNVEGKNVDKFVDRIIKNKIHIIQLIPISYRQVHLIMKFSEYQKLLKIKSVLYKITILSYMGSLKIKKKIKRNLILLFFLLLGVLVLLFLSRIIFSVEVIHQDREVRNLVLDELHKYGIQKFGFKRSYHELESIEDSILKNNKDRLEWIEIVSYGTKYSVHVEERKIGYEEKISGYQNIVSRKEAVIVSVKAIRGEKLKNVNDYVKMGDIIIAGYVTLPNNSKIPVSALGEVLGEVWYKVKIDYPFVYQESMLTGKSKTVYAIHYFGKRFGLFDFQKYHSYSFKNKILFSDLFLNVHFVKEKQYEMVVKDEVYTEDIVKIKAISYVKDKLMKDNSFMKEIKDVKVLSSVSDEDSIKFQFFVRAVEAIGVVQPLDIRSLSDGGES